LLPFTLSLSKGGTFIYKGLILLPLWFDRLTMSGCLQAHHERVFAGSP